MIHLATPRDVAQTTVAVEPHDSGYQVWYRDDSCTQRLSTTLPLEEAAEQAAHMRTLVAYLIQSGRTEGRLDLNQE